MLDRRKFLTGLISLVAAPAIVRAGSLMPVKADADWRYLVRAVDIDISEVYGRSPAMMTLTDAQELLAMRRAFFIPEKYLSPMNRRTERVPPEA